MLVNVNTQVTSMENVTVTS